MKKVRTLTPPMLADASEQLLKQVKQAGYSPDLVVGIASGGSLVVDEMVRSDPALRRADVSLYRPTTKLKRRTRTLGALVRRLPLPFRDRLRVLEDSILALAPRRRRRSAADGAGREVVVDLGIEIGPASTILLVDDAVDSGGTLARASALVSKSVPGATIVTATLVDTRPNEDRDISVDFCWESGLLVRFPWSLDYR